MLALKLSFSSSGWVIWPPNSISSTLGFTFRIILSGSWHNLSLRHLFFPEKSSLWHCARNEPLLPASDPCELHYANITLPLPHLTPYLVLVSCSSENTALLFAKSHQFFPPEVELGDILIAFHYFQQLPPPTPDLSLSHSLSHHPLPGLWRWAEIAHVACIYCVPF